MTTRIAVVTNLIPSYRFPIFEALSCSSEWEWRFLLTEPLDKSCADARAVLTMQYVAAPTVWLGTRHKASGARQREPLPIPWRLLRELADLRPNLIVAGDWGARTLFCWLAARRLGIPMVVWSEDIASSAQGRSRMQRRLRSWLGSRVDAVLAWGEPAATYARSITNDERRVFECPQAAHNDYWLSRAATLPRIAARERLGLAGKVALFVGRLEQRKGIIELLSAWAAMPANTHVQATLVIVGDGALREAAQVLAGASKYRTVRFAGFKSGDDLAEYYAAADFVVLPSLEDVWGFAVNEAHCFGLPVLASRFAGAGQGIVERYQTGEMIDPTNLSELAERMAAWISAPIPVASDRCRNAVADMNYDNAVRGILGMVSRVIACRGQQHSIGGKANITNTQKGEA